MKILVTGAKGFIGKNLVTELKNRKYAEIYEYDSNTEPALLDKWTLDCGFVFHLAGVNRPADPAEFMSGNFGFTSTLLDSLKKNKNKATVMISSSIQAELENAYGKSKKAGEELLRRYSDETGAKICIYRFPNVFGKWCRPNYNSAVATFCYNISHNVPIQVNDPNVLMNLVYIDDVVEELISALNGGEHYENGYCNVPVMHTVKLGLIAELIESFRNSRENLCIPDMGDPFTKKLYSTYLSYLPEDSFSYPLAMNIDDRGSFTEFLRTSERGQVSINVAHPHITKGQHWHHTKNEKFLVVSGHGLIQFRKIGEHTIINYHVTGDKLEVIDIPVGYTHNIINEGDTDMITVMWANESFDPEHPDTYFEKV